MSPLRYIAQRVLTREILDMDVPLTSVTLTHRYSGPDGVTGVVPREFAELETASDGKPVLEPWSTALYAEEDGRVYAGGILEVPSYDGPQVALEFRGFTGYPTGLQYTGHFKKSKLETLDAVREIWRHVQEDFPTGNIGVIVDQTTTTGVLLGTETNSEGEKEPYQLEYWDSVDCGQEIDKLGTAAPFGYRESHAWNAEMTDILTYCDFKHPHFGAKRHDLEFQQGLNMLEPVQPTFEGAEYANEGIGLGKGEGDKMTRARVPNATDRIRRTAEYKDDTVGDVKQLKALTQRELAKKLNPLVVSDVVVWASDARARYGTYWPGDGIHVKATLPHIGDYDAWHVVTDMAYQPATGRVALSVEPIGRFPISEVVR